MLEIVVLAILVLAVVGSSVLGAAEKQAASQTWPLTRTEAWKGEPVDEGANVREAEQRVPDEEMRKAA